MPRSDKGFSLLLINTFGFIKFNYYSLFFIYHIIIKLIINKIEEKLVSLRKEIESVKKLLSKKEDFLNDDKINKSLENNIALLGSNFRHHEKEYADVKFYCNEFLEEMLKRGEGDAG